MKLSVGAVLSRILRVYGDHAGILLPVAAAVFLVEAVLGAAIISLGPAFVFVAIPVQLVASTLFTGMVVELVSDVQDGRRDHSVVSLFRAVTGVVVPLILAGLLTGLAIAFGLLLLIVPGLILLTIWAVVAPVIVIERRRVLDALGRSQRLVSGNVLEVFLVILCVFALSFGVSFAASRLLESAGTSAQIGADLVLSILLAPIIALAGAVLYFELLRANGEAPGP